MEAKILIIDDEPEILYVLETVLTIEGFQVCTATGGKEALARCETETFDLAITDIRMPEMDGVEVITRLKRRDADLEILVLTGFATLDTAVAALKEGRAFNLLKKPLESLDTFLLTIRQGLERRRIRRENQRLLHELQREITIRKQTEQTLTAQKTLLDEVFNGVQEGLALVDEHFTIVFANPAYAQIVEVLPPDIIGRNVFAFFEREERSFLIQERIIKRNGAIRTYELPLVTMLQTRKYVRLTVAPRLGADGVVLGEFITMLDITTRKQAEDELTLYKTQLETLVEQRTTEFLRANQELTREISERMRMQEALSTQSAFLEEVINGIQEGLGFVDQQETIMFCNPAYAKIFDEEREQLIGKNLQTFFDPDIWASIQQHTIRAAGEAAAYEVPFRTRRGQSKYIHVTAAPRFSPDGNYIGTFGVVSDITKRKQQELALQEAKQAAEEANRVKSEFLANMSHELRTPLNAVLGYAQLLKRDLAIPPKQRQQMLIIETSGFHLLHVLNDLIELSRIEVGNRQQTSQGFNLAAALQSIMEIIRLQAEQKGLTFHYEEAPGLPYVVFGDERRLRQVLFTLLGNAVKFTAKGVIRLRVSELDELNELRNSETQKLPNSQTHKFRFEVEDTGIGISPERFDKIFIPFEHIKHRKTYTEGAGLGLPLSQRLLHIMQSELHVKSTPGQGTLFWFDLLLAAADAGNPARMPVIYADSI